ncbi:TIGR01777 family oxidoreductase [Staphylococcus chromogenes]|nr:TIGR01777 family oxidoreductase [Staphylococcus chromogenes]
MSFSTSHVVPFPLQEVWDWHTTPGAVARLTPPFAMMHPIQVADSLATGTTIFALPGGLRWVARHDLTGFQPGRSFTDVCTSAPIKKFAGWRHHHQFSEVNGSTKITDTVTTRVPTSTVSAMFAYRQHQLIGDLSARSRLRGLLALDDAPKTVAITGSRGLIGREICAFLSTLGIQVIPLVRSKVKPGHRLWDPTDPDRALLDGVDALIHLAGEPIFGRFTAQHKQAMRDSRVEPTRRLAELVDASDTCTTFITASAIGYYGAECGLETPVDESSAPGTGFLAELVTDWEHASQCSKRVVNIRNGVVLSGRGGSLPVFRALCSAGLGGNLGSGEQHMSWIAMDDCVDVFTRALVDPTLRGPINAVAPAATTNADFVHALASLLRRPTFLPIPTLGPRLLLGSEGAKELALANQRVTSQVLHNAGFEYRFPALADALAHELGGEALAND